MKDNSGMKENENISESDPLCVLPSHETLRSETMLAWLRWLLILYSIVLSCAKGGSGNKKLEVYPICVLTSPETLRSENVIWSWRKKTKTKTVPLDQKVFDFKAQTQADIFYAISSYSWARLAQVNQLAEA